MSKAWKESSTLILAAQQYFHYNNVRTDVINNYALLLLKRHENSNVLPGRHVFPGGMIEPEDADLKWYNLYNSFGVKDINFQSLLQNKKKDLNIFHSKDGELPREISLRISAIRETFEESGVLICSNSLDLSNSQFTQVQNFKVPQDQLDYWREKVHSNAADFYNMCEKFQCFPNLWGLYEWSNWLTPTALKPRFNTMFFISCMPEIAASKHENKEIEEVLWASPDNILSSSNFKLAPPQHYEISKIARFKKLDQLQVHILHRKSKNMKLTFPVAVGLLDGLVMLLPGDSIYPTENIEFYKRQFIDKSSINIEEFRKNSEKLHRIEYNFNTSNVKTIFWNENEEYLKSSL